MIRLEHTLILSPQLSPTEARIVVTASVTEEEEASSDRPRLEGSVIGPLCEYAVTLSSRVALRPWEEPVGLGPKRTRLTATARILEPCFWEPQHPFCYEISLELRSEDRLLDMRRIIAGIRHLAIQAKELFLNGQEFFLDGVRHAETATVAELEAWHEAGCGALLADASSGLCERTDRWGPMVLHLLAPKQTDARDQVLRLRNHPSLLMWVVPPGISAGYSHGFLASIRAQDPSRPIGQLVPVNQPTSVANQVDVLFLSASHAEVGSAQPSKPYVVVADDETGHCYCSNQDFREQAAELREGLGARPGLVGVIL